MAKTIISVKELVKHYGSFKAVKGISFDVYEGEIFGLLGPNGAGKSTTLEIIETLRTKTSGEIYVAGFNLDKDPGEIKKIIGVPFLAPFEEVTPPAGILFVRFPLTTMVTSRVSVHSSLAAR